MTRIRARSAVVAQSREICRTDVKQGEHTQDQRGTQRELLLGAFSGFLSGNCRPMRRVPNWEMRPDLERPEAISLGELLDHSQWLLRG